MKTSKESFRLSSKSHKEAKILEFMDKIDSSKKSAFFKDAIYEYVADVEAGVVFTPYLIGDEGTIINFDQFVTQINEEE